MSNYLNLRLSDAQDGYEISYKDELLDFVSMEELATAKSPDRLMRQHVQWQRNRIKVRQFVSRLDTLHTLEDMKR